MADPQQFDVHWEAFRYVAEEMSADEMAQFESRLADDQPAREAVAGAVELVDAIAIVSADGLRGGTVAAPQPVRRVASTWGLRLRWIAVGAAAAVAFVLLSRVLPVRDRAGGPGNKNGPQTTLELLAGSTDARQFALLWCDTRDEMASNEPENWPSGLPAASDAEPDDFLAGGLPPVDQMPALDFERFEPRDASDAPVTVPSWMLAAVGGDEASGDDGGSIVGGN